MSFKDRLLKLNYFLVEKFIDLLVAIIELTNPIFCMIFFLLYWLPNKRKSLEFFKPGELYIHDDMALLQVWKKKSLLPRTEKVPIMFGFSMETPLHSPDLFLDYKNSFLVLGCERKSITELIIKIIYEDRIGYCKLVGNKVIRPWKYFKKL